MSWHASNAVMFSALGQGFVQSGASQRWASIAASIRK
jgi:hypothetical protein